MSQIVAIRLPDDWLPAIDAAALHAGLKRNTWLAGVIRAALPAKPELSPLQTAGGYRRKPAKKRKR